MKNFNHLSFYKKYMKETRKFDLDDIAIVPAVLTNVDSRKECRISTDLETLPLIASPMDTVVCTDNYHRYIRMGIIPCIPRGKKIPEHEKDSNTDNLTFQSFGINVIEEQLDSGEVKPGDFSLYKNVLIDIANGHMERLERLIKRIKNSYPYINLMVGNVANPKTYEKLAISGADFVRLSIGTGAGCTTAANVAINYPLGSLISECREIKIEKGLSTKIVADGGMRDFSDIIKALGLGADYVMLGSIFNKTMESAGFNYLKTPMGRIRIKNYDLARKMWKYGFPIYKKYRGMSTKSVQRSWGKAQLVTSEGITKYQKIEYTLEQWVDNFKDYLKSNMSYSGVKKLEDFIGYAKWILITENARKRFAK
jgi:IMP dehydrogenase/GMP reductase